MSRSAVPPPVTMVLDAASNWLPGRLAEVERGSVRSPRLMAARSPRMRRPPSPPAASACGRCSSSSAPGPRPAPAPCGPRPRSSWSTWRPWSMTTSSMPRRCVAGGRRSSPAPGASARSGSATCSSRVAFAGALRRRIGRARQVALLANASVSLARGELTQRRDAFDVAVTAERYLERCRLKTASLFECATTIGRSGPAADATLIAYGRAVGLAFQLLDDVLDVTGPPERTGKARGTDLLDGTVTMPFILARRRDPELAELDLRAARSRLGAAGLRCDRRHRRSRRGPRRRPRPGRGGEGAGGVGSDRRGAAAAARGRRRRRRRALFVVRQRPRPGAHTGRAAVVGALEVLGQDVVGPDRPR